jgi:DtxR family Mn-dependent transcriptional regulator
LEENVEKHDISEEVLEAMWGNEKEGSESLDYLAEQLGPKLDVALMNLLAGGKVEKVGDEYFLTDKGEKLAVQIVRRHRLAERLFYDVLGFSQIDSHRVGCGFEHFLEEDTTDAVCSFLGHPPACPSGRSIPRGKCCRANGGKFKPLIISLHDLGVGKKGRVTFIKSEDHKLTDRLFSLGIYPGQTVKLHQKLPSYLVQVDETEIGIESDVASSIFVRHAE